MSTTKKPIGAYGSAMPPAQVAAREAHRQSGAAGVHQDQKAGRKGGTRRNRQNTRQAAKRAAIADQETAP